MSETKKKPTTRRNLISAAGFTAMIGIAAMSIAKPDASAVKVLPTARTDDADLVATGLETVALTEQRKPLEERW